MARLYMYEKVPKYQFCVCVCVWLSILLSLGRIVGVAVTV